MRSDYALYVVALIFFVITVVSLLALSGFPFERNLSTVATVVLGLLFLGVGYTQRPRAKTETLQAPSTQPIATAAPSPQPLATEAPPSLPAVSETVEAAAQQKIEPIVEPIAVPVELPKMELTAVKGIKEKRAEQLRALGISSVQELANASAEDLAKKLKIAPYFTQQWIENAKEIVART
jgi:predicted flap endonuclease-1-like 5' DNA nuclease